jgi:hypothetical protein
VTDSLDAVVALPPHTLENVGDELIHVIVVELKDPAHRA